MRVLIVHNKYREPGGEERVVAAETRLLRQNGIDVEELCFDSATIRGPIESLKAAYHLPFSKASFESVKAACKVFQPDIVHVHNFFPLATPAVFAAAREFGAKTVFSLHNYRILCANGLLAREGRPCELCVASGPRHAVKYRCYQDSLLGSMAMARMISIHRNQGTWHNQVDKFIALTEFSKTRYAKAGLPVERFAVKSNFLFDIGEKPAAPRGVIPRLVFVGRLSPEKGISTLLKAKKIARSFELHIVGDGPMRRQVEAAREDDSTIHWHGAVAPDQVHAFISAADALVFPSECYENFPMVILEAMMNSRPVLGSLIGGIPEIVQEGVVGEFFEPGNPVSLAQKIDALLADRGKLKLMGEAGRKKYRVDFTPEENFTALTKIYSSVL